MGVAGKSFLSAEAALVLFAVDTVADTAVGIADRIAAGKFAVRVNLAGNQRDMERPGIRAAGREILRAAGIRHVQEILRVVGQGIRREEEIHLHADPEIHPDREILLLVAPVAALHQIVSIPDHG